MIYIWKWNFIKLICVGSISILKHGTASSITEENCEEQYRGEGISQCSCVNHTAMLDHACIVSAKLSCTILIMYRKKEKIPHNGVYLKPVRQGLR